MAFTDWKQTPNPTIPQFLPQRYHQLFHHQDQIGWNHILHGRFSILWNQIQVQSNNKTNKLWLIHTIRTIWHYIAKIWKHRCDTNHGTTPQTKRQRALHRLTPLVQSLYNKQDKIDPVDNHIFDKSTDEILQMPTNSIERWAFQADKRIRESIEQLRRKTQRNTQSIHQFFQRVIPVNRQVVQQQQQQRNQNQNQNQHGNQAQPIIRRNLVTRTITSFFQINQPPAAPDPFIPEPPNDNRPP